MDLSKFIVIGFLLTKYLLVPVVLILTEVYFIVMKKKLIAELGSVIIKYNSNYKFSKFFLVFNVFLIISSIFFSIFDSIIMGILVLVAALLFISIDYKRRIFSKLNGIYENGIIHNDIQIKWKDLFSYKTFNKDGVSLLLKTGFRFDLFLGSRKNELVDLLKRNSVSEEK